MEFKTFLAGTGYPTGKNTRAGTGMGKILYPRVYMGNPTGRIFFDGYGYGMVLPDGYVPIAIPNRKGSPREGQAPRSSNSVESRGPSPRASGAAPLPAPLGHSPPSPLSSFRPKRRGVSFPWYTVAAVTQTRLSRSRKTLAPLDTITTTCTKAEGLCGFSKLTQLTRFHLEQVLMRSN